MTVPLNPPPAQTATLRYGYSLRSIVSFALLSWIMSVPRESFGMYLRMPTAPPATLQPTAPSSERLTVTSAPSANVRLKMRRPARTSIAPVIPPTSPVTVRSPPPVFTKCPVAPAVTLVTDAARKEEPPAGMSNVMASSYVTRIVVLMIG